MDVARQLDKVLLGQYELTRYSDTIEAKPENEVNHARRSLVAALTVRVNLENTSRCREENGL